MDRPITTVFGGTGFLGSRIARELVASGSRVRIAARRPVRPEWATANQTIELVTADVRNEPSITRAVTGARGVVNAVSLYTESGQNGTFESVHVQGATRVARAAQATGVERMVLVSGMGVDPDSPSRYVRARMRGEELVRAAFPSALVVRPSVIFGPDDAFLQTLDRIARLPAIPLFGRGETRLQPVFVDDVAKAVVKALVGVGGKRKVFELGGAGIHTYREIVEMVLAHRGRERRLVPVPFPVWHALAVMMKVLPNPPLTTDQVRLMERDNVVGMSFGRFAELGIEPRSLAECLAECLDQA
jgi:NADH dehydrogenase